jgi:hypothetical protein
VTRPDVLRLWTVYDHPKDFPHNYVARMFTVGPRGAMMVTEELVISPSLEGLRTVLVRDKGMSACLSRDAGDDPRILETWI